MSTSSLSAVVASISQSSAGGGGASNCQGVIDLAADNGPVMHYAEGCDGSSGPAALGFESSAAGDPPDLQVIGCVSNVAGSEGLKLRLSYAHAPGSYSQGDVFWTDAMGVVWGAPGDPFKVDVTKLDPVGGTIEGNIVATVSKGGNVAHSLTGTFHVCHVKDSLLP